MSLMDINHLLHRAGQVADSVMDEHIAPHNITPRQFRCMQAIGEGAVTQTDVMDATGIDRSTVMDICRRLAEIRMVDRERSVWDARCQTLKLTERGARTLARAAKAAEIANDHLLASLRVADRVLLERALQAIVDEFGPIKSAKAPKKRIKVQDFTITETRA